MNLIDKETLIKSMAVPFRCGGATYVDGELIYKTGEHFISRTTLDHPAKTTEWWENWYATHDHSWCIEMQSKIPQRKRR